MHYAHLGIFSTGFIIILVKFVTAEPTEAHAPLTVVQCCHRLFLFITTKKSDKARAITQGSHRSLAAEANSCGICGEQNGTGTGFSRSAWVLPCRYYSINPLYSFIVLPIESISKQDTQLTAT
jgi:hypothetical protein